MPEATDKEKCVVKHNVFYCSLVKAEGVYGPRLWLPSRYVSGEYEVQQAIRDALGKRSLWGNYDKSGVHCLSWEFSDNKAALAAAQMLQDEFGFCEVDYDQFDAAHPFY